ncbi:MAG: restriction endonuclease subunit S [Fibrobacter sp.]|nr:restriction endonuclease subunit S [Fibrobacter sp.]
MNTKLLKQKILDLAIRGKLTQQLKSDGNTADLLKEISSASHPERSAKGAKSKDPGTIIPLDKSEAPFEIPANWEWVRLNQITELIEDCPHSTACDEGAGYPLIRTPNIGFGHLILEGVHRVSEDVYRRRNLRATPQPNDLIFAREAPAGNIAVIKDGQEVCLGQRTVLVRPLRNILCSYYLAYYILSSISQKRLVECSGGSTVAHVNLSVFRSYEVPLPPLAEQQRIVAKIEEAFAEIDSIENNKELLKTHIKQTRQKILDLAIHGKLVPQNKADEPASILLERITRDNPHYEKMGLDERRETKDERDSNYKRHSREGGNLPPMLSKDEVPFEVPENWCWCRLGDICKASSGKTPSTENNEFWGGDILWVTSKDVKQKYIESTQIHLSELGAQTMNLYRPNTMIIVGRSGILRHTLPVAILKRTATINQDLKALVFADEKIVEFVYVVLKAMMSHLLHEYKKAGTTVDNLNFDLFLTAPIPLPPLAEQSRIVAKIEELFTELDLILQNI